MHLFLTLAGYFSSIVYDIELKAHVLPPLPCMNFKYCCSSLERNLFDLQLLFTIHPPLFKLLFVGTQTSFLTIAYPLCSHNCYIFTHSEK